MDRRIDRLTDRLTKVLNSWWDADRWSSETFTGSTGLLLIIVAGYGKWAAYVNQIEIIGGIIACGVFLLLISIVGNYPLLNRFAGGFRGKWSQTWIFSDLSAVERLPSFDTNSPKFLVCGLPFFWVANMRSLSKFGFFCLILDFK